MIEVKGKKMEKPSKQVVLISFSSPSLDFLRHTLIMCHSLTISDTSGYIVNNKQASLPFLPLEDILTIIEDSGQQFPPRLFFSKTVPTRTCSTSCQHLKYSSFMLIAMWHPHAFKFLLHFCVSFNSLLICHMFA
jgi:hypothetical protein